MKWLMFIIAVLLLPSVLAINTTMQAAYQPGETMIIQITGNILQPIQPSDIVFRRNHIAIAVNYDVKRLGNNYYLYAQLPSAQNNYTIHINDVATTVNGVVTEVDYAQNFSVQGSLVEYNINPGFVTTNSNVVLTSNLNLDSPTTIDISFPAAQSFTLQPGSNTITLQTSGTAPGVYMASIGRYTVPIEVLSSLSTQQDSNVSVYMVPPSITRTILEGSQISYPLTIVNNGTSTADNLAFLFNTELFEITPVFIDDLAYNSTQTFNITLKRDSGLPIKETISITRDNEILGTLFVNISFTSDPNQTTSTNPEAAYYCAELSGTFCAANEVCSSATVASLDGACCVGTCTVEDSGGFGWIGYTAIAVIIIVLIIVYMKYKKSAVPKPKTSLLAPVHK